MRTTIFAALAAAVLGAVSVTVPAKAISAEYYEVIGVESDDMLKMRAGPGIEHKIIVGLPNGTVLRVHSCEDIGTTGWCMVSLKQARGLKGYVSWRYLQEL
jgi:uncharacterized protein YraI